MNAKTANMQNKQRKQKVKYQKRNNVRPSIVELGRDAFPAGKRSVDGVDKLVANGALTEDGANWLTMAIDPFHDYKKPMAGYPDIDPSGSTVICKKYTMDLAAPGVVDWDAHIFTTPISRAKLMSWMLPEGPTAGWYTQQAMTTAFKVFPLTVVSAGVGQPLFPTAANWAPPDVEITGLPAADVTDLTNGTTRIVAAGFEVVNTTPALNRGGRLLAYSMPQCDELSSIRATSAEVGNLFDGTITLHQSRAPPTYPALAAQYLGSQSWGAEKGVYMPIPLRKLDNPYRMANSSPYACRVENTPNSQMLTSRIFGAAASAPPCTFADKETGLGSVGCFLTGLSKESTFTITLKVYIEKIPSHDEAELCALASPGACYDPSALALYSYLLSKMPIAMEVAANAHGDWFRSVLKTIYSIARPISSLFKGGGKFVDRVYGLSDKIFERAGSIVPIIP